MDPILTKYVREPESFTLDFYLRHQGYEALRKALAMKPDDVVELVRAQRLAVAMARSRGLDPDRPRNLTRSVVLEGDRAGLSA